MCLTHRYLRACRKAGLFIFLLILGGCAAFSSVPETTSPLRDSLTAFSLEGRFSLRHEDKIYSGRLSWKHSGANNELLLASPFGQGLAEVMTSSSGARLITSDGKAYSAASVESLTDQVLGYPLPLALLADWVRGWSSGDGVFEKDGYGRVLRSRHEDWTIEYGYNNDGAGEPPSRIFAQRVGGFELRLRIDEWTRLSPGEDIP